MSSAPLYNSKIFATYLKLVRRKYGYADIPQILNFAGIKPQEIHDPNHWFSRHHLDRFYEKVVEATGEAHIAREAGRFLAAPEAIGYLRHYILGMVSPAHAFKTLQRGPTTLSRSCHINIRTTAANQVEINVQPRPGIQEPPSLCLFRTGLFEAIVTTFNLEMPEIEHTECQLKGDNRCRYLITWKNSFSQTFQRIRNLCGIGVLAGSATTGLFAPALALQVVLPLSAASFLGLSFIADCLQKKSLRQSIHHLRSSSEQMVGQIRSSYNNALLTNELSQAISSKTSLDDILTSVSQALEKRLDFRRGVLLLSDAGKTRLTFQKGYGLSRPILERLRNTIFHLNEHSTAEIFSLAFAKKAPFLVNDVNGEQDGLPEACLEFLRSIDSRAMICCPILCDGKALGVLAVDNPANRQPLTQSDLNLLTGLANVLGISIRNAHLLASRKRQFNSMLHVLAATIDARDPLTAGHSEKVTEYSLGICRELGLSEDYSEMVRVAALLHDYGKVAIPDAILKKKGRLTVEEYETVKTHAEHSQDILSRINFEGIYKPVPVVAGAHHEKIDGSGYPKGLKDKEIPLGAKIIAVADFFEAITSQRHYRGPMPLDIAYRVLKRESCSHFDAKIVMAFLHYLQKHHPAAYRNMLHHAPGLERAFARVPCRVPVVFETGGDTLMGTSTDISTRGIFVASHTSISEGTRVKLSFSLPTKPGTIIETGGRVAWVNRKSLPSKLSLPSGFGVEFIDLQQKTSGILSTFVHSHPADLRA